MEGGLTDAGGRVGAGGGAGPVVDECTRRALLAWAIEDRWAGEVLDGLEAAGEPATSKEGELPW